VLLLLNSQNKIVKMHQNLWKLLGVVPIDICKNLAWETTSHKVEELDKIQENRRQRGKG
jgi:hypothetical protein